MADLKDLQANMPIDLGSYGLDESAGMLIVDEVNGFATVGAGPLAPPVPNEQVTRMVAETDKLAKAFRERGLPVAAFLDTHEPNKPEPPYPPHCEKGTGQEDLVPELKWLEADGGATLIRKDCINGFVGSIDLESGRNKVVDWATRNKIESLVVVGICTDICVMDFVLTALSARNHGLMPQLKDIVVYEPGCATYDLSAEVAAEVGLPDTAQHPQFATHHMGLYFMQARGALLADRLDWS